MRLQFPSLPASLALVALTFTACTTSRDVRITVTNRAAVTMTDVKVDAGGQVMQTRQLQPGQTHAFTLKVQRDSDVALTFTRGPRTETARANTYLTHGMHGQVDLTVTPDWAVTTKIKLRTGWF